MLKLRITSKKGDAAMNSETADLDKILTRAELAKALTGAGYPITKATLDTMATRGGGPVFRLFGKRPLYGWGDAIEWARARMSPPVRTTSEARRAA